MKWSGDGRPDREAERGHEAGRQVEDTVGGSKLTQETAADLETAGKTRQEAERETAKRRSERPRCSKACAAH
jgi:hypothetical protein